MDKARLKRMWVNLGFRDGGGVRPEVRDLPDEAVANASPADHRVHHDVCQRLRRSLQLKPIRSQGLHRALADQL